MNKQRFEARVAWRKSSEAPPPATELLRVPLLLVVRFLLEALWARRRCRVLQNMWLKWQTNDQQKSRWRVNFVSFSHFFLLFLCPRGLRMTSASAEWVSQKVREETTRLQSGNTVSQGDVLQGICADKEPLPAIKVAKNSKLTC